MGLMEGRGGGNVVYDVRLRWFLWALRSMESCGDENRILLLQQLLYSVRLEGTC